jgi:hypothetical protein
MLDFLEYARFFGICQIISWSMPDFLEYAWYPGICQISWNMCDTAVILENIRLGFLETTLNSKVWFITFIMISINDHYLCNKVLISDNYYQL